MLYLVFYICLSMIYLFYVLALFTNASQLFLRRKVDKSTGIEVVIIYFQSLMLIALGAYCSDHAVNFIVVSPFRI